MQFSSLLIEPHLRKPQLRHQWLAPCGNSKDRTKSHLVAHFASSLYWRRGWDSNPRNTFAFGSLATSYLKPLRHLSIGTDWQWW